jgi:hypothetical protein
MSRETGLVEPIHHVLQTAHRSCNNRSGRVLVMFISILGSAWRSVVNQVRYMGRPILSTVSTSHVIGEGSALLIGALECKKPRKGQPIA